MRPLIFFAAIFLAHLPVQSRAQYITRIGVLADLTNYTKDGIGAAASMAAKEIMDRDQRIKVETFLADHQRKPDVAANIVRQWIDQDRIDVVFVSGSRAVSSIVANIAGEKGTLSILSDIALPPSRDQRAPTFNWTSNDQLIGLNLVSYLIGNGLKDFSIIAPSTASGSALAKATSTSIARLGGKIAEVSEYNFQSSWSGLKASSLDTTIIMFGNFLSPILDRIDDRRGHLRLAIASPLLLTEIDEIGRSRLENTVFATPFYWDANEATRDWSKRLLSARRDRSTAPPDMIEAGVYSAVRHYLRARMEAGNGDAYKVAEKFRQLPVDDFFAPNGKVRANGQLVHPIYIVQVRPSREVRYVGDYLKVLEVIPGIVAQEAACGTPCPKTGACPQNSDQPNCPCPKSNACPQ
jgi:branched-chain amino acid transport system substrate-binding protein